MRIKILLFLTLFSFIIFNPEGYSQNKIDTLENVNKTLDSLSGKGIIYRTTRERPDVKLSKEQALEYLQARYKINNWNNPENQLRKAIGQLIFFASNRPFDSTKSFLEKYPYDSIKITRNQLFLLDTIKLKIPVSAPPAFYLFPDSIRIPDSLNVKELTNRPYACDSIKAAINSLIGFVEENDSSILKIAGASGSPIPVWLNSKTEKLSRFWLRNQYSDSVTLWVGGVSRNTLGLYLEEGITFRRPTKQSNFSDARLNLKQINSKSLQEIRQTPVRPQYWKVRSESAFIMSQTSLSNWVRGGEGSVSTAMDLTGYADYNNRRRKVSSNNYIRLKYGLVKAGDERLRKNQDLLESNSKLNHKAFGKFDFSAVLLFKTQISKGYNYPNDTVPVSKFLNPAILTFGLGLDYKPNKTTSINFSPLSYKVTFVSDTGRGVPHIDQTKYGIPRDRRSLHEPGASLIITNEFKPFKDITLTNRLQLFTNYIHNPQNIDVDWEMIVTSKINWFTDVRFNTHLIFDDDTKTPVLYKDGTPKLGTDGKPMKTARIQFKELLGFTFVFRF
jgi:hypothetical protein